jgi:hypothetical protein
MTYSTFRSKENKNVTCCIFDGMCTNKCQYDEDLNNLSPMNWAWYTDEKLVGKKRIRQNNSIDDGKRLQRSKDV